MKNNYYKEIMSKDLNMVEGYELLRGDVSDIPGLADELEYMGFKVLRNKIMANNNDDIVRQAYQVSILPDILKQYHNEKYDNISFQEAIVNIDKFKYSNGIEIEIKHIIQNAYGIWASVDTNERMYRLYKTSDININDNDINTIYYMSYYSYPNGATVKTIPYSKILSI